jgi:probable rRNA maturation factor
MNAKRRGLHARNSRNRVRVEVQFACARAGRPDARRIARWARTALAGRRRGSLVTVRVVGEREGARLNRRWRGKRGATNVLSFPGTGLPGVGPDLLGDIVICAPVVDREARKQGKARAAHWAHMVVHGTLHLLGYDHRTRSQAVAMESLEVRLLERLGVENPYE